MNLTSNELIQVANSEIYLRFVSSNDAQQIVDIYSPSITKTSISFEYEVPSIEEMRARIEKVTAKYPWLVAVHSGRVVGYAYGSQHRERPAYKWSVEVSAYVHFDYHKQGIGRLLYRQLFALLRAQGFYNAYAGITLPNISSVALHESFGFKHLGNFSNVGYKFEQWHDVGWWSLELKSPTRLPDDPLPPPNNLQPEDF